MVPALESSIESLEKKTLMDCGTNCSVCLEEVLRGCEGLVMPCLHVFHEDCIKEWLRTSYYCPVCRFEMPKRVVLNLE
ncbi:E3 ubiquitin-protein ligase ring1-like [Phtheirospermum japonicum]|uniref:RING-type E3 ubiquitin transferase n=1 Tax=Phtheirospermum japonicum TaxID=374723 RepID=A0A830BZE8_9LAMI|nr:E3 ubiquitin-protein ligase ring1-like [Phtheirospermum japonicum]